MRSAALAPGGAPRSLSFRPSTPASSQAGSLATSARSVLVSTAFALGLAGVVVSLGELEVSPAQASAPVPTRLLPMPQARLSPSPVEDQRVEAEAPVEAESRSLAWLPPAAPEPPPSVQADPDEVLGFGPMKVRRHLVQTVVNAAQMTGIEPALLMSIADKESSFVTEIQARTSSATGLFQFIEKTWLLVVAEFGAKHGLATEAAAITVVDGEPSVATPAERARILDLRRDSTLSALLAGEMLNRDRTRIAKVIGRDLTAGETYIAHFLGPDDAERFLAKLVSEPGAAAAQLLPKPARANRSIFYARARRKMRSLTLAEVHQKFEEMMSRRTERYRDAAAIATPAVTAALR